MGGGDNLPKTVQRSSIEKKWTQEQSILSREAQWTQPWSRVQPRVDAIYLVRSTGAIMSIPHLHSVKSYPEKSRLIKYGGWMHGVMIAIEHSYYS